MPRLCGELPGTDGLRRRVRDSGGSPKGVFGGAVARDDHADARPEDRGRVRGTATSPTKNWRFAPKYARSSRSRCRTIGAAKRLIGDTSAKRTLFAGSAS